MTETVTPPVEPVLPPITPPSTDPKWWVDEGMPGQGDRPGWLPDKFKTVADLGKSYKELESKVGTAPEDYDLSKATWLDPDYTPFQEMKDLAKSKRVPAEVMDKMLDSVGKYLNEFTPDYEAEAAKLGDNAKERLTVLNNWAKSNLSQDSFEALTGNLKTADSIKALEEIRTKMMEGTTVVPNGNTPPDVAPTSVAEIQAEMQANLEKYKTDPIYRKTILAKIESASKNGGYVDNYGG